MALINIKDLPQSVELDRKAMLATVGGARGARQTVLAGTTAKSGRIVDYPPGFTRDKLAEANAQRPVP